MLNWRVAVGALLWLSTAAGCIQLTRIDVDNATGGTRASAADIAAAKKIIEVIAEDFGFVRHPREESLQQWHRTREWAQVEIVAAYINTESRGFGRTDLLLALDREDGHLVVKISDRNAYSWSNHFVESLEKALLEALDGRFPGRHIEVDRRRW